MVQRTGIIPSILLTSVLVALTVGPAWAAGQQAPPPPPAPAPVGPCGPGVNDKNVAPDSQCFELRTYTVRPEGPGSIDLLHARFRQHTNRLFRKHGIHIVGFWHPTNKPNSLIYILSYKDRAARDAAWKAFQSDPEWVKVRGDMQVGVQVEAIMMSAVDYGPMK